MCRCIPPSPLRRVVRCIRRPAAVLWACLGLQHLVCTHDRFLFLVESATALAVVFGTAAMVDAYNYSDWTFPPWNFVLWNAVNSGAVRYGSHPWHWYVTQGLPTVFGPGLALPLVVGQWHAWRTQKARPLSRIVALIVAVYSTQAHKEFRFVLPALPLLAIFSGHGLAKLNAPLLPEPNTRASTRQENTSSWRSCSTGCLAWTWLLLLNIPLALYFGLWVIIQEETIQYPESRKLVLTPIRQGNRTCRRNAPNRMRINFVQTRPTINPRRGNSSR
eukprot:COSAG05_NODE_4146_length_1653_cov_1.480051_2_plen_274_part_01